MTSNRIDRYLNLRQKLITVNVLMDFVTWAPETEAHVILKIANRILICVFFSLGGGVKWILEIIHCFIETWNIYYGESSQVLNSHSYLFRDLNQFHLFYNLCNDEG